MKSNIPGKHGLDSTNRAAVRVASPWRALSRCLSIAAVACALPAGAVTVYSDNLDSMGAAGTAPPTGWTAGSLAGGGSVVAMSPYGGNGQAITSWALKVSDGTNDDTVSHLFNFGATSSSERSLGSFARSNGGSGKGDQIMQVAIVNTTGQELSSVDVSYAGEQWRQCQGASSNGLEKLHFLYSTTSATDGFVNVTALDFTAPQQTGTASPYTALDGNLAANRTVVSGTVTFGTPVPAGGTFYLRWHDWNEGSTYDHWLAVDDLVVTATSAAPAANMLTFELETAESVVYPGTITETANPLVGEVAVYVLAGTDVTSLTPTFTLSGGATSDPASGVAQDFTNPVVYTVTSSDSLIEKSYTVTVTEYTPGSSYVWAATAAGTYAWKAMNWNNPGWPDGVDHVADMNIDILGSQTINLNETITLGTLELGDAASGYVGNTIAAGTAGSLVMDVTAGSATISRTNTNVADTISANIQLNDNLVVSDANASDSDGGNFGLKLTGSITQSGGSRSVTKSGGGAVTLSGTNNYSGGTTVNEGGYFRCSPASIGTGPFIINGNNSNHPDITSGNQPLNGNEVIINGGFKSHYGFKTGTGPVRLAAAGIQVLASVDIQGVVTALDGSNSLNALDINLGGIGGWGAAQTISSNILMRGNQIMTHDSGWGISAWPGYVSGAISDGGNGYSLTKAGTSHTVLTGTNTYTGDTIVTGGRLELANTGSLAFKVTNSGSNKVTGAASIVLNGAFNIDTSAVTVSSGAWTLVDVGGNVTFGSSFTLPGFTKSGTKWTKVESGKTFIFDQTTGKLVIPAAYITSFNYGSWAGIIDQDALTISLTVPSGTNLATLNPTFTLLSGTCDQTSGSPPSPTFAVQNPATYTVTDGAVVRAYEVTVTVAPAGQLLAQNFDTDPVNYTGSGFLGSGNAYWNLSSVGITPATPLTNNATIYLTGCNMDSGGLTFSEGSPAYIDFTTASLTTSYTDFRLSVALAGNPAAETANYLRLKTDNDGDGTYETTVFNFLGNSNSAYTDTVVPLGALTTAFQTFSNIALPTPTAPDGKLRLRFEVFNESDSRNENTGIDDIVISGTPLGLTVTLTSPADAATFSPGTEVVASATVMNGTPPYTVKFFSDVSGTLQQVGGNITSEPYQVSLGTPGEGNYQVYATVDDSASGSDTSATHTFSIENQPPTVAITSPTNGSNVAADFTIQATATDDAAVVYVSFYDNEVFLGVDDTEPFSWDVTNAAVGYHALKAVAIDEGLLEATSATVNVTRAESIGVGTEGSGTLTFDTAPFPFQWTTLSVAGAAADLADEAAMDTAMASITAASISTQLPTQSGSGALGNAYWRSGDQKLGTQPTGNKMTLLMATLKNTSGGTIGDLTVSYLLENLTTSTEQVNGHRIYWSTDGTTWTAAGSLLQAAVTTTPGVPVSIDLPGVAWGDGTTLYLVWADDNGDGTDGIFTIDNLSLTITVPPVTSTWTGASLVDDNWSTGENWNGNVAPSGGEELVFGLTSRTTPLNDLTAGTAFGSLLLDATAPSYTISGNSIAVESTGTIINAADNDQTINLPLILGTEDGPEFVTLTNQSTTNSLSFGGAISGGGAGGTKTLTVDGDGNSIVSGDISNGGSSVALKKDGTGTLSVSGVNTYSGDTTVRQGAFTMTDGSLTSSGNFYGGIDSSKPTTLLSGDASMTFTDSTKQVRVGASNGGNPSSMVMSGTSALTTAGSFSVGGWPGGISGSGEFAMTDSSVLTVQSTAGLGFYVQGDGASGTSHMLLRDNAVVNASRITVSSNFGTLTQTGGEVNCTYSATAGNFIRIANGAGRWGWYNMTGGKFNVNANPGGTAFIVGVGMNRGIGFLNLTGTAEVNIAADADFRLCSNQAGTAGYFGEVNLAGGTLTTPNVTCPDRGNLGGVFNFNGGTLKAARDEPTFMHYLKGTLNTTPGAVYVHAGGAVIDTNGFAITIGEPLLEPAGQGVTSVSFNPGTQTYVAPPRVSFSNPVAGDMGYPMGAQGFATLDASGNINGIVMTNPGLGYTAAPTVSFDRGDASATATLGATNGGGLTKNGLGTLTLSGANTYTGDTVVNDGTLVLGDLGGLMFKIGANGVNNKIRGSETATVQLDGSFTIDLTGAAMANGNRWTLVDVDNLSATFGDSFMVLGDGWLETDNVWTLVDGDDTWTFTEATGELTYSSSAVGNYASWAATNAGGQAANLDYDNDGVANGIEYFMGQTGSSITTNPGLDATNTVTWPKDPAYNGTWQVQTSSDLSTWTDVAGTDNGTSVSYTLPAGAGKLFVRLVVTPN